MREKMSGVWLSMADIDFVTRSILAADSIQTQKGFYRPVLSWISRPYRCTRLDIHDSSWKKNWKLISPKAFPREYVNNSGQNNFTSFVRFLCFSVELVFLKVSAWMILEAFDYTAPGYKRVYHEEFWHSSWTVHFHWRHLEPNNHE